MFVYYPVYLNFLNCGCVILAIISGDLIGGGFGVKLCDVAIKVDVVVVAAAGKEVVHCECCSIAMMSLIAVTPRS